MNSWSLVPIKCKTINTRTQTELTWFYLLHSHGMRGMAWSNVRRWRWSPQITSLFPWSPGALLLFSTLTKTICLCRLASARHWFVWQRRGQCTCQRCGAHLYSNKQLSPMPAARGGADSLAWVDCTPGWVHACVLRVIEWVGHVGSLEEQGNTSMNTCVG